MGGFGYDQNNNNLMNSNLSTTLQTSHSMFADNSRDKPLEFNLKSNLNASNYYSLIEQYEQRQMNSPSTLLANNQPMIAQQQPNQVSLELLSSLLAAQLNLINPYLLKQQQQQPQQFNQPTVNFLLPFQGLN